MAWSDSLLNLRDLTINRGVKSDVKWVTPALMDTESGPKVGGPWLVKSAKRQEKSVDTTTSENHSCISSKRREICVAKRQSGRYKDVRLATYL